MRRHRFVDQTIDLQSDMTEEQLNLDGRACIRCGGTTDRSMPGASIARNCLSAPTSMPIWNGSTLALQNRGARGRSGRRVTRSSGSGHHLAPVRCACFAVGFNNQHAARRLGQSFQGLAAVKTLSSADHKLIETLASGLPTLEQAMIRTCGWPSAGERDEAHLPEEDLVVTEL
jgi:hypothetical protein